MNEIIAGRYALVSVIGEGGMATVYLAVDTILKREVAIKVLRGELSKDDVSLTRFKREAVATTKLSHPNIVEIYDVGEDNGKYFIVMEYVKGKSLKELIVQRGALEQQEACDIMKQLVSAVSMAHRNGIIHRDIKSQNVLIKDDGTVKLSDFGIALAADSVQLTQTDVVIGSVHYMAPELAKGKSATAQSDIYALGIVFYEMLTGDVPHHGDSPVATALKHMREEIPNVRNFNPTIYQSVDNIIRKATVKDPSYRYQSASEMSSDILTCLSNERKNEKIVVFQQAESEDTDDLLVETVNNKKKAVKLFGGVLGIALAIVFAIGIFMFIMALTGGINVKKEQVQVPYITNMTKEEAEAAIIEAGLNVSENINYELTKDIEKGKVARSSPAGGVVVDEGTSITIYISEGNYFYMYDFTGWKLEDAQEVLSKCNIRYILEYEDTAEKESGIIVSQSIAKDTQINPNRSTELTFVITRNPTITIPSNLRGMDYQEAISTLEALGVKVEAIKKPLYEETTEPVDPDDPEAGENTVYKPKADEDMVDKVYKCSPDFGERYTQTTKSVIKIYYYYDNR